MAIRERKTKQREYNYLQPLSCKTVRKEMITMVWAHKKNGWTEVTKRGSRIQI
jgi:hypothetical protein